MQDAKKKIEFKFPFEPPWEDLRMEGTASNGAKFYIFDSCVIRDPLERSALDQRNGELLARIERRRFMEALNRREAEERATEEAATPPITGAGPVVQSEANST